MPRTAAPVIGLKFGRLQVLREDEPIVRSFPSRKEQLERRVTCACDCGKIKNNISLVSLRNGGTSSCGCWRIQRCLDRKTHGDSSNGGRSPEYGAWSQMIARCENENHRGYKNYGGRGITVCQRWRDSYANFLADMGRKPNPELSIEREDNERGYEPGNCVWTTSKRQVRNRRCTRYVRLNGELLTLGDACEQLGLKYGIIKNRLYKGWSDHDALTRPVRVRG